MTISLVQPPRSRAAVRWPLIAALLALAGCGTRPPASPPPDAQPAAQSPAEQARDDYEARLRAQAVAAMTDRRWNDAALAWELLSTLRPADPLIAGRLSESRERNEAAMADLEERADQAMRRGDLDAAAQRWWAVLALDPLNESAAAALRKLETDRNRKTYLGRHAGSTLTRRAVAEAETMPGDGARPAAPRPAAPASRPAARSPLAAASSPAAGASGVPGAPGARL